MESRSAAIIDGTLNDDDAIEEMYERRRVFDRDSNLLPHLLHQGRQLFETAAKHDMPNALRRGLPVVTVLRQVLNEIGLLYMKHEQQLMDIGQPKPDQLNGQEENGMNHIDRTPRVFVAPVKARNRKQRLKDRLAAARAAKQHQRNSGHDVEAIASNPLRSTARNLLINQESSTNPPASSLVISTTSPQDEEHVSSLDLERTGWKFSQGHQSSHSPEAVGESKRHCRINRLFNDATLPVGKGRSLIVILRMPNKGSWRRTQLVDTSQQLTTTSRVTTRNMELDDTSKSIPVRKAKRKYTKRSTAPKKHDGKSSSSGTERTAKRQKRRPFHQPKSAEVITSDMEIDTDDDDDDIIVVNQRTSADSREEREEEDNEHKSDNAEDKEEEEQEEQAASHSTRQEDEQPIKRTIPPSLSSTSYPDPREHQSSAFPSFPSLSSEHLPAFHRGALIACENLLDDHSICPSRSLLELIEDLEENRPNVSIPEHAMVLRGGAWVYSVLRDVCGHGGEEQGKEKSMVNNGNNNKDKEVVGSDMYNGQDTQQRKEHVQPDEPENQVDIQELVDNLLHWTNSEFARLTR